MTRMYIQPSFVDSCHDHGEWSGGNGQYRGDRSVEVVPTYINGKPNVKAFSDQAIEARRGNKKTSVPLKQRILPQAARVEKLTEQMRELVQEYKQGLHTAEEYTLLLSVVAAKRARAEELLAKAVSVKAPFEQEEEAYKSSTESDEATSHTFNTNEASQSKNLQQKRKFACNSAVRDAIVFLTGSMVLLVLFKVIF